MNHLARFCRVVSPAFFPPFNRQVPIPLPMPRSLSPSSLQRAREEVADRGTAMCWGFGWVSGMDLLQGFMDGIYFTLRFLGVV